MFTHTGQTEAIYKCKPNSYAPERSMTWTNKTSILPSVGDHEVIFLIFRTKRTPNITIQSDKLHTFLENFVVHGLLTAKTLKQDVTRQRELCLPKVNNS